MCKIEDILQSLQNNAPNCYIILSVNTYQLITEHTSSRLHTMIFCLFLDFLGRSIFVMRSISK